MGKFTRVFTPKKTELFEDMVRSCAAEKAIADGINEPLSAPVGALFRAVMPIPKSWSKAKRSKALSGDVQHVSKPDADNLAKAVFDALNGVVLTDDSQIVSMFAIKEYGEVPRVELIIGDPISWQKATSLTTPTEGS
jgi:Holliday junction resolvase RusA-like endonuclease